jgi:hypothetical protein
LKSRLARAGLEPAGFGPYVVHMHDTQGNGVFAIFRDFFRLPLTKENRRQLVDPACDA